MICRQFGGESFLRTLESGHTANRADQFDPDGWQLPEIAELCQNNDQGFVTHYMTAIVHLHQRPRSTNGNAPTGNSDAAPTRSRRPQQKVPSNGNETARSCRTNLLTSPSRFKTDEQTNCTFQNHEHEPSRRPALGRLNGMEEGAERCRSSTHCNPERRQRCDVMRTMRDLWESVATHSPRAWWHGTQRRR